MSREVGVRAGALLMALSLAPPARAGTVRGRVELLEKGGRKASDLSEIVVYVDGVRAPPRSAHATMVMKGKSFTPRVIVVPVGATVEFPNQDSIFHNVFSLSGENRFDLDLSSARRAAPGRSSTRAWSGSTATSTPR